MKEMVHAVLPTDWVGPDFAGPEPRRNIEYPNLNPNKYFFNLDLNPIQ